MPKEIIEGFAYLKSCLCKLRFRCSTYEKRDAIAAVCDEILAGKLEDEFPW
jgi:fumarate hydratase class II